MIYYLRPERCDRKSNFPPHLFRRIQNMFTTLIRRHNQMTNEIGRCRNGISIVVVRTTLLDHGAKIRASPLQINSKALAVVSPRKLSVDEDDCGNGLGLGRVLVRQRGKAGGIF